MKKAETTETNYVGHVLDVREHEIRRKIQAYNSHIEYIKPFAEEYAKIGLSPLTSETVSKIMVGAFDSIIEEFKVKATADIANIGFVFRPIGNSAIDQGIKGLRSFLVEFQAKLRTFSDTVDCPIVDGIPTITPEFKESIREGFTSRIKTQEGSEFYERFLVAQLAVKDLFNMGGRPEFHFDWDINQGLRLLNVAE